MALTMFVFMHLWSIAFGAIENPLDMFCESDEQEVWVEKSTDEWYWGDDYNEKVAQGDPDVYPAGFQLKTLQEFNEPPVCITVPNSGDKKVEILIETVVEDAHICIHDASDIGFANNDVGNVDTCGMGLLYACFTAAEAETENTYEDFSFYVYCKESCEASDVGFWLRVRTSTQTWQAGKTGVDDDLEMWCEMEKGTKVNDTNKVEHNYFSYPEDLVSDNPLVFPYKIVQVQQSELVVSGGKDSTTAVVIIAVVAVLFLIVAGLCVAKNHELLPECCQKFIPCADKPFDEYE